MSENIYEANLRNLCSAWPVHRERGLRSGTSFLRRCLNLGLDTCMVYYHI